MEICWDNLEGIILQNPNFKTLINIKTKTRYHIIESCLVCKEEFLSPNKNAKTCGDKCRVLYSSEKLRGREFSKEHKKNISKSKIGIPNKNKGKQLHTKEQKLKWSKIRSNGMYKGQNNPRFNDHRSFEELYGKEKALELKKEKSILWTGSKNCNSNGNHWIYKKDGSKKAKEAFQKSLKTRIKKYGQYSPYYNISLDEQHGIEKSLEIKEKISNTLKQYYIENGTIPNNNMSRGFSGWYNDFYFRSSLELSYLLWANENNNDIISAETKSFSVPYIFNSKKHTYFPDFYNKTDDEIIEIKPYKLLNNEKIKVKKAAAIKIFGNKYKILTENDYRIKIINKDGIKFLYENNIIKITKFTFNRLYKEKKWKEI